LAKSLGNGPLQSGTDTGHKNAGNWLRIPKTANSCGRRSSSLSLVIILPCFTLICGR
jgi:hypothetical protein